MKKTEAEIALEMYQSVMQSNDRQKKLKSSRFWGLFKVKSRRKVLVERIEDLIDKQGLRIAVKSGATFGEEDGTDWIMLSLKLMPEQDKNIRPIPLSELPSEEWFEMIQSRGFESEREVEAYFIAPLLEELGYDYDDIVIGYPVEMIKGVQKTKKEADFVLFNGGDRTKENVLLVVEAKKSDKGISGDHIGQAKSYAKELLPACYMVSNGQRIMVFQFNGMLVPDVQILDLDRTALREKWVDLYNYISKDATVRRKQWMQEQFSNMKPV